MKKIMTGKRHTDETKQKISTTHLGVNSVWFGKKFSKTHRNKISIALKDRVMTKQHKENLSKSLMGHTFSGETKKKMSIAKLGKMDGKKNPMYGRIGESAPMFGKKLSIEAKHKISEARKKYWLNKHNAE